MTGKTPQRRCRTRPPRGAQGHNARRPLCSSSSPPVQQDCSRAEPGLGTTSSRRIQPESSCSRQVPYRANSVLVPQGCNCATRGFGRTSKGRPRQGCSSSPRPAVALLFPEQRRLAPRGARMPLPERPRTRSGGRVCAYADISPDFSGPSISLSIDIRTRQRCFNRIGLDAVVDVPPTANGSASCQRSGRRRSLWTFALMPGHVRLGSPATWFRARSPSFGVDGILDSYCREPGTPPWNSSQRRRPLRPLWVRPAPAAAERGPVRKRTSTTAALSQKET